MNQDAERIADRIRHLEEKEKAVKKLQRQAAKEHKRNEQVRKARQQLRDPGGFTGYLIASLAGAAEGLQEPEPQTAAPPERTQEGGERDQKGKRRSQIDSKPIADNSPLLMFVYLV